MKSLTSRRAVEVSLRRWASTWANVKMAPADPILGLSEAFQTDADPRKVNLGVGAYRDDSGKPYVLPSIREAERRVLAAEHNHEYLPIVGLKSYTDLALKFAYGEDSSALSDGRVAAMQTLSGTGSLRLATEYFNRWHGGGALYVPNPTWGNHIPIAEHSGLEVRKYSYFNPETVGLDFTGMMDDVNRRVFFMYRYILRESCSQFHSLPLTSLTISARRTDRSSSSTRARTTRPGLTRPSSSGASSRR